MVTVSEGQELRKAWLDCPAVGSPNGSHQAVAGVETMDLSSRTARDSTGISYSLRASHWSFQVSQLGVPRRTAASCYMEP